MRHRQHDAEVPAAEAAVAENSFSNFLSSEIFFYLIEKISDVSLYSLHKICFYLIVFFNYSEYGGTT